MYLIQKEKEKQAEEEGISHLLQDENSIIE